MKNLLKITLLTGSMAAAISVPVSAGNQLNDLRGMYAPQAAVSEFEGRYVQPQSHDMSWQQKRLQAPTTYAQPSQHSSSHYNTSPHRTVGDNYGRFGHSEQRKSNYSRFGSQGPKKLAYGNVYDYESGHCGSACAPARPTRTYYRPVAAQPTVTYRQITQYKCWDGAIVDDYNGCARQTITTSIPQYRCWDGEVVTDVDGCKRQTVTRQVMSTRPTSHVNSYGNSSAVKCPTGTSKQSDGTCLESSSMSYSAPSHSGYSTPTNCPSGTTAQSDGTCMEGGSSGYSSPYAGTSVELFTVPQTTPSYGYNNDNSYGLRSSLPIRK